VGPKLKSLLARITLVGGVALAASFVAKGAPHDQSIAIRFGSRELRHVEAVVTPVGDEERGEATAGFSEDFPGPSPHVVRHSFSATNGTYIVVITFKEELPGENGPNLTETTFQRRVSLVGGEVIVSPD
jgi:hypothetical protein